MSTVERLTEIFRTVFDDDPSGPRRAENAVVFRTQVNF